MSLRFRRSVKIAPGLRLNFNKSSLGLSFGVPGARISVNTKGDIYSSTGIPGTGLYNIERSSLKSRKGRARAPKPGSLLAEPSLPSLFAPRRKKALYRALFNGKIEPLEEVAKKFPEIKYVALALAFPRRLMGDSTDNVGLSKMAAEIWAHRAELEKDPLFTEYARGYEISIIAAPGVSIPMQYGVIALGLSYIELLQLESKWEQALAVAESLPANQATALAVCENEVQLGRWKEVLETTEEIDNVDDATALLLIYRAIALREQGLNDAAIETLKLARSSRSRHEDVLNKALYERAICYQRQGKKALARKDLEKIIATDSDFPGVADLLNKLGQEA